ncbi:MAG: PsbP-related protein [Nitrososphaeraceae archaeon]
MHILLIFSAIISIINFFPIYGLSDQTSINASHIYENEKLGLTLNYPNNWQITEETNNITILSIPNQEHTFFSDAKINITLEEIDDNITINNYSEEKIKDIKTKFQEIKLNQDPDFIFNIIASNYSNSYSNQSAYQTTYEHQITPFLPKYGINKELTTLILKNNTGYTITYSSEKENFDKYLDDVENILSSLKIR